MPHRRIGESVKEVRKEERLPAARVVSCPAMNRFYDRRLWRRTRKQALHDSGHVCQRCGTSLVGKGRGAIVHHRKELKRAPALAIEPANLTPLCIGCHNATHAEMKHGRIRSACDEQGYPLDAAHPWFQKQ